MSIVKTFPDKRTGRAFCKRKFLHYFRDGFKSQKYKDWERDYKWNAHLQWESELNKHIFEALLDSKKYLEIARIAVRIESRTNLLFSFEKMALRDAVSGEIGARVFTTGLYHFLYGDGSIESKFNKFLTVIESLPRKQTRVFTWPVVTVFGFIAEPRKHIFFKPLITKAAAKKYRFPFEYISRPNWETYHKLLLFSAQVKKDLLPLKPRDMIDIQSFIWVTGSEEYPDRGF